MQLQTTSNLRLFIAALIPFIAAFIQWQLWSYLPPLTWLLFYPAVFFSARIGGLVGGVMATLLATLLGIYIFIPPQWSWEIEDLRHLYSTGLFVVMGLMFSYVFDRLQRSTEKLIRLNTLELEVNQNCLAQSLLAAGAGNWEWNLRTHKMIWGENLWRLYYLEAHSCEPSYEAWINTVQADDRVVIDYAVKEALDNHTELNVEWRLARLIDGKERWLMLRGQPEFNVKGELEMYRGIVIDISERKRVEKKLLAREREFRFLAETMPQIVWITRADGGHIYFNQQWVDYTGLTLEQSYGHGWSIPFHSDDREHAREAWQNAVQKNAPYYLESRLRRADGVYRWWLIRGEPILEEDGRTLKWFGTYTDIHALKLAEAASRVSEARWQFALEGNQQGVWDWDIATGEVFYSTAWKSMFGYTDDDIYNRFDAGVALIHADDIKGFEATLQACLRGEKTFFEHEHRMLKHNGDYQWTLGRGMVISHDHEGQPLRMIGTVQDITERKQKDNTLRLQSTALEVAANAIMITDAQGIIEWVNPAFTSNTGYTSAEAMGKNPRDLVRSGEQEASIYASLWQAINNGQVWRGEFFNRRKNGSLYLEEQIITPMFNEQGKLEHLIAIQQDITERNHQAVELREHRNHLERLVEERTRELIGAREQAEHLTLVKSSFLSNMSHEIRTPMNAVLGFCYLLEQQTLSTDAHNLVSKINSAGRSLLAIINDILDFSKIEAGRLDIECAPFRLLEMLDQLAALMSTAAGHKNLELTITPPLNIDALMGDGLRLQQVLTNLLSNAIKFTEQGEVTLRITVVSEQEDQLTLRFMVKDTGIGISYGQQQDLFSAFSQADTSISRRFGGTGLGLAISLQLVTLMGGTLQLVSTLGEGSEFCFELSLKRDRTAEFPPLPLDDIHLLVVDDNRNAREALLLASQCLGWCANGVDSGVLAILQSLERQKTQRPYDIILLDWKMPVLDGLSTAQILRKAIPEDTHSLGWMPIILMITAYSYDELIAHPDASNVDALLSKPVTPLALFNAVHAVLRQRQQTSEFKPALALPASSRSIPGIHVLVVDDSDVNREVAQRILEAEGAVVSLATNGLEALEWLNEHAGMVDIVLMDIQMPYMDGYATTKKIRQNPRWSNLPVVALTAGAFKNLQDTALESGMNDFISKPFNVQHLIATIQRWTGGSKVFNLSAPLVTKPSGRELERSQEVLTLPANNAQTLDLPGINLEAGLKIWKQVDKYQGFLSRFMDEYHDVKVVAVNAMAQGEQATVVVLVHKLKGAAYALQLDKVARQCIAVETALSNDAYLLEGLTALQQTLDEVAASLVIWLTAVPATALTSKKFDVPYEKRNEVEQLFSQLLQSFSEDNPRTPTLLLSRLEPWVGTDLLTPIKGQVQDFKFREAEVLTQALIDKLNLSSH